MRKIIFVIMVILLSSVMIVTSYGVTDIPTGDINGDGRITAADARLALRAAASLDLLADTAFVAADVNQDGKVTAADARAILRKAAGLDESDKEAVPADFDRMSDLLADMIDVEFDYETADTAYVVDHIIHDYLFIVTYYNYFNDAESDGCDYTDPLGKLMFYYKVPAENVRWICENIYQVEFDENYVSAEGKSYCYDGYVYIEFAQAGYGCDFRTEIDEYKVLDDGKYEIVASSYSGGFEDFGIPDELMYRLKVIAEWKQIDGKYDWVFFSVEHVDSPDFDRMKNLLSSNHFAEFDCETADAHYVLDNLIFAGGNMPANNAMSIYEYYFTYDADYIQNYVTEKPDPLGIYDSGAYYRVPVENLEWICENIYQVEFDENDFIAGERSDYCYGGDYYRRFFDGLLHYYTYSYIATINSYTLLDDGKYEIIANYLITNCVDESVVQDQDYKIIAEWKLVDGKFDWVFYSVKKFSSPDFERMENLLNNTHCAEFDCETADTAYVVDDIIHAGICIPTYNSYFGSETYQAFDEGNQIIDPLNKFIAGSFNGIYYAHYFKVPAENIKWICENIYQTEFDENYTSNTGESYYYDGYVYIYYPQMGGLLHEASIDRYQLLSDGKYEITVQYYVCHQPDEDLVYDKTLKVIAEWKQIDGKYDWVFYSVEHIDSPDFDRMETLVTNMFGNTFDYKTADTAYVVDYLIHAGMFLTTYETYFGEDSYEAFGEDNKNSDPLNKFSSDTGTHISYPYYKIPAENIKWICENIYRVEFDENYKSNTGESYCYGDYVYIVYPQAGYGPFAFKTEINEYRLLDNGKYEISAYYYESEDFGSSFELECRLKVIAEWKLVDGKYDWVFYNIDKLN